MSDPEMAASQWIGRRSFLQAGTIGALGLSTSGVDRLLARPAPPARAKGPRPKRRPRAVIFLFLTGGASQHDTFDMKPDGPAEYRGEFRPIATRTPGIKICEHLPLLAMRSRHWALVRSLTHKDNGHQEGTYLMLTGRSQLPSNFKASKPQASDWPSIAAVAGAATARRGIWPGSAVLPEKIVHSNQGVYPGQFAGMLGNKHEPWFIDTTDKPHAYHSYSGAFPKYLFDLHKGRPSDKDSWRYEVANLTLPEGVLDSRHHDRLKLLNHVERQQRHLEASAAAGKYDDVRRAATSLLTSQKVRQAFDVRKADARTLARYGDNSFGWSLLMARRLVEAGVNMVQVNMGNFGSWDLHGNNFTCLKNYLFPPTDRAVSGLLDDLHESGLLDSTLVVMAGEFGRTPKITHVAPEIYKYPGRDHWAPVQSVLLAGGGVRGGAVVGSSDKNGAYPASDPQTPENFAATIYHALGIPGDAEWHDATGRPYPVYQAKPIHGLMRS
jgi:hypothetical protein